MRPLSSLLVPLIVAIAGLALGATALLYVVTASVIRSESDAALRRAVDVEIAALADIHATGGKAELIARIHDRLALRPMDRDRTHYMLADASGRHIAGDLRHWPLLSAENSQAGFVEAGGAQVFARATQLSPDLRIVAAREYGGRTALLARVRTGFLVAGLAILAAALAIGWIAAARLRKRVERINEAFRAIEAGDFDHQLASAHHHDELDELAGHAGRLIGRLSGLIESQREVTDQVAHEVRTPLAHLDAHVLQLIERTVDPALAASLAEVRQEARGVADLLDSLLDIAASEARRGDRTGLKQIDLSEVARSIADLYADSAADMGLDFHTAIAPEVIVAGDAMQLSRVISNLLDNAFKYSGDGARIELLVEPGPRIIVRDNGPGVPAALRDRIFERFQRGADSGRGHGLGLALVRAIARRHGLEVVCRDARPGAEFVIERRD